MSTNINCTLNQYNERLNSIVIRIYRYCVLADSTWNTATGFFYTVHFHRVGSVFPTPFNCVYRILESDVYFFILIGYGISNVKYLFHSFRYRGRNDDSRSDWRKTARYKKDYPIIYAAVIVLICWFPQIHFFFVYAFFILRGITLQKPELYYETNTRT